MPPQVLAVGFCAGEQRGQRFDLFGRGLPALEAFGGDGLGQGVSPGLGQPGYHVENVDVDAR